MRFYNLDLFYHIAARSTVTIHRLPVSAMLIDGVPITPAVYVRDLEIYLLMWTHVQRTVSICFAACVSCDRFVTPCQQPHFRR